MTSGFIGVGSSYGIAVNSVTHSFYVTENHMGSDGTIESAYGTERVPGYDVELNPLSTSTMDGQSATECGHHGSAKPDWRFCGAPGNSAKGSAHKWCWLHSGVGNLPGPIPLENFDRFVLQMHMKKLG